SRSSRGARICSSALFVVMSRPWADDLILSQPFLRARFEYPTSENWLYRSGESAPNAECGGPHWARSAIMGSARAAGPCRRRACDDRDPHGRSTRNELNDWIVGRRRI